MKELEIKIQLEALVTEREGMIAENIIRGSNENYYSYDGDSFLKLAEQINELVILARDSD